MKLRYYAIITHDGQLKRGSSGFAVYKQYARACFWAKDEGDSVVPLEIDLGVEPLFIRKKIING